MALVPLQPDPQLPLVREERAMILLHLVRVEIRLHDDTLVGGFLRVVATERATR